MTRLFRTATTVAVILMSATFAVAQARSSAAPVASSDTKGWKTVIYPVHAWLPVLGANVRLPEQPAPPGGSGGVTVPSAQTSGSFSIAAAAGFRVERSRFALEGEFLWAGLSASVTTPRFEFDADTIYFKLLGGVELLPALYIDGGVRRVSMKMNASILDFPRVTWQPGIWEPVVGMTFRPQLSRNVRVMIHTDLGGIGDDRHRTATATALVEWKPVSHLTLGGGYGVLYLRADGTILGKAVHLRQTLEGPMLTLGIPF
jgi:hypothetical protein